MNRMSKLLALAGIGHDAPPARAWALLLVAFVAVSVYGNTAHALLTGHGWAAAAWFAVAPVALFWVTHLVAKTAGRSPHGAVKWLIWFGGIPAALTVAGMAFVVSFRALRAWTLHQGGDELSSILLPLIVDVIIALSSAMVLATRPKVVNHPAAPVDATSTSAPVEAEPAAEQTPVHPVAMRREVNPVQSAPTAATQPDVTAPLRDLVTASTPGPEPTSVPAHREAERDVDTDEIALTSNTSREASVTDHNVELPLRRLAVVPAPRRDREAEREVTGEVADGSSPAVHEADRDVVRDVEPEPAAKQPVPLRDVEADVTSEVESASTLTETGPLRDAESAEAHLDLAQRVIDAGRTTATLEDAAAVIAAKASGLSNKKAADATGVGESTVQRIWTAARELEAEPAPVA